ncbi:hypothetical protein [Paenibacillus illinoisensis]|uniref:hypothetical protein n=1 Tax=Paenibacillus illinoisensis TaxID=59845 RepID=UPI003018EA64
MKPTNKYTMKETMDVAKQASLEIEQYLWQQPETLGVVNLEDDPYFQALDIDLAWETKDGVFLVEIKGDRYYRTGNYFFEVVSNQSKNSLGCFMYTEADFVFYYFIDEKELHVLPMPQTREWFNENKDRYQQKTVSTSVGTGRYFTVGKLVPRDEVKGKQVVNLSVLDKMA